jgi:putative ATPase
MTSAPSSWIEGRKMARRESKSSSEGLFEGLAPRPLADRLRPKSISEIVGQDHLLGSDGPIGRMVATGRLSSMVLWGPPGCGKTTLARLLAEHTKLHFEPLSAVFSGVADLRRVFDAARGRRAAGQGTLLFIDEIHRFNRAQQDGFLPYVEDGTVILVGATTENPSFELNAALLSRAQVFVLNRLDDAALEKLMQRAEQTEGKRLPLDADARRALRAMADGDGRYIHNMAEELFALPAVKDGQRHQLDVKELVAAVQRRAPLYDKAQEGHYNLISALHKSLRGSDTDAALYWLARMLVGGEDPLYVARRLVRFAIEDIGLADPQALVQALAAWDTYERLGSPEGELALAQCVIYLGTAPKSNAAYVAMGAANSAARETGSLMPPKHILNAPTKLMRDLGYAKGYEYDHNAPDAFSGQDYFPEGMARQRFYEPVDRGFERDIKKRLEYWDKLREQRQEEGD